MALSFESTADWRFDASAESSGSDLGTMDARERNFNEIIELALQNRPRTTATTTTYGDTEGTNPRITTAGGQDGCEFDWTALFPPPVPPPTPMTTLHAQQEWEGYVIEIGETEFVARLLDLTAGASVEEEEAIIPMEEISDDDRGEMRLGSVFRWVIGDECSPAGTRRRVSRIVFRDLPAMTESDLREGTNWARDIAQLFNP